MPTPAELRVNAEARFKKKELQRLDGCAAMVEYEAASRATAEKTAKLKALRLSRAVTSHAAPAASKVKRQAKIRGGRGASTV